MCDRNALGTLVVAAALTLSEAGSGAESEDATASS